MTTPRKKGSQSTLPRPHITSIPNKLGKCIAWGALLVEELGWEGIVRERRGRGDFMNLGEVDHPARRLLRQY